ncbi:MAG: hypothetical protein AAF959_22030 [Cyanobacteria bacterium P01_D01_bin.56]
MTKEKPVTVTEWIVLLLLFSFPVVNLIALAVFAFGYGSRSIVNFARAAWIFIGVAFIIGIFIGLLGG